jgi:small-conductance mechanosensitive channel
MKLIHSKLAFIILSLLFLAACSGSESSVPPTVTINPTLTTTMVATPVDQSTDTSEGGITDLADSVPTRTPEPTATPGPVARGISRFVEESELPEDALFFLKVEDWINLAISVLFVLGGYLIGTWVIRWLLPKIVRRTSTPLDDRLLEVAGPELRWLIVIVILQFATERLVFVSFYLKNFLEDLYFLIAIALIANLCWRLINVAADEARKRATISGRREELDSLIELYVWAFRFILIVVGMTFLLTYFGIDITGFAILLVVILVIISLAGRDTVADIVAGTILLLDRPFRVGDRIDLPEIDSWGDVIRIGMRSTQVRTKNNRLVIIPNSKISKEQIVNYNNPDSLYRHQSDIGVAYDNDVEQVVRILEQAVRQVDGVLVERPIQVLLLEFRENDMVFRVRWWIESYQDYYHVRSRVNKAMIAALKNQDIILPYASVVDLKLESGDVELRSSELDDDRE